MTEKDDLMERLGYHREDQVIGKFVLRNPDGPEAAARITELKAKLAEAREALRPFAEAAKEMEQDRPNENSGIQIKYPDLRRAARALSGKGE